MDRRVVVSALAALGAVLAGVGAVVVGAGQLSIVAVLAGVIAAAGIASFGIAHRDCRVRLRRRRGTAAAAPGGEHAPRAPRRARHHADRPRAPRPTRG